MSQYLPLYQFATNLQEIILYLLQNIILYL